MAELPWDTHPGASILMVPPRFALTLRGRLNLLHTTDRGPRDTGDSADALQRWGAIASFVLAVAFIVGPAIHLFGDGRTPLGRLTYDLGDVVYGPVWAVSLVTAVSALRERLGERAPRRMLLALLAAALAAGTMIAIASIRFSNRHYHDGHPELNLQQSTPVLVVWTTMLAGLYTAALQFLGWALVLIGSAGWTSRRMPRPWSILCIIAGAASILFFIWPVEQSAAVPLTLAVLIWQAIVLWRGSTAEHRLAGSIEQSGSPDP
jgi:hypothetical protein